MKTFDTILSEAKGKITDDELVDGFTFFVVSKDGRSASRYKITGEVELNVGTVLNVKHAVIAGDKFKQDKISKEFVLGTKGGLKVFRTRKEAIKAFKMAGLNERRRDTMSKDAGDADRAFRPDPPKCECGRRYVSKKGKKCILCKREGK